MWSILGCVAGQDMVLVSVPTKHGKLFYAHLPQPGMVSTIDIPFRFSVLDRARVSNPQRHPYTQTLVKRPFPPTPGAGGHRSSSTLQNLECRVLWSICGQNYGTIPEQNAITLPVRANNNLNSLSTALSALSPYNWRCREILLGKQLQRGLGNNCLIHRQ